PPPQRLPGAVRTRLRGGPGRPAGDRPTAVRGAQQPGGAADVPAPGDDLDEVPNAGAVSALIQGRVGGGRGRDSEATGLPRGASPPSLHEAERERESFASPRRVAPVPTIYGASPCDSVRAFRNAQSAAAGTSTTWPQCGHLTFLAANAALALSVLPQPAHGKETGA